MKLTIFYQALIRIIFVLFTTIVFFQLSSNTVHAQWVDRNSAAGAGATSIKGAGISSDGQTMIIVGDGGFIKTSTNGGSSWTDRNSAAGAGSTALRAVSIGPSGQMLVLGDGGYNRSTTDGGASWTNHNSACGCATLYMLGAAVGPSNTLLAVATDAMFTSSNSGTNWTNRTTAGGVSGSDLYSAVIGSNGTMLAGGTGVSYLRSSTNGGVNWTNHASAAGLSTQNVRAVAIGSSGQMYAGGTAGFIKTSTDGGSNWTDLNSASGVGSNDVRDIEVDSNGNFLVVGTNGYIRTYTSNTAPSITSGPSIAYVNSGTTRTGPNNAWQLLGAGTDSEQTGSNQLTFYLHTGANRTGTQACSQTFTSGVQWGYSLCGYNAPGLAQGSNTLYLSIYDGSLYSSTNPSFTVLRDDGNPSTSGVSYNPTMVLSNNQYTVTFTPTDAVSTSVGELRWWIRTVSGGGGSSLINGSTTTGSQVTTGTITDNTLSTGSNNRYVRVCDGADNCIDTLITVTKVSPATITLDDPSNLNTTSVTLNAQANPNSSATTAYFRVWQYSPYSCLDAGGTRYPISGGTALSGSTPQEFTRDATGLIPNKTYYYCAIATNQGGTNYHSGTPSTFTTPNGPQSSCDVSPTGSIILSGSADCSFPGANNITGVDGTSMTLNSGATLLIQSGQTVVFQTISKSGAIINKGAGGILRKGYVWVKDTDGDGRYDPSSAQFSTSSSTPPGAGYIRRSALVGAPSYLSETAECNDSTDTVTVPTCVPAGTDSNGATNITSTTATLNGVTNPNGDAGTRAYFKWGSTNTGDCDTLASSTSATLLSGTTSQPFTSNISGLSNLTSYYFCTIVYNNSGTSYSNIDTFVAQN